MTTSERFVTQFLTYLSPDSAPPKSVIFRISAARCLSAASSRKPEKSLTLGDLSAIGVPFSLVPFLVDSAASLAAGYETYAFGIFGQAKEMNNLSAKFRT